MDVSVSFVNAVGKAESDTVSIELTDADLTTPGKIVGRVTERDVAQPSLTVFLADAQGYPKYTAQTDSVGSYEFIAVVPGKYRLVVKKPATPSKADKIIDVPPGETVTAGT